MTVNIFCFYSSGLEDGCVTKMITMVVLLLIMRFEKAEWQIIMRFEKADRIFIPIEFICMASTTTLFTLFDSYKPMTTTTMVMKMMKTKMMLTKVVRNDRTAVAVGGKV